MSAQNPVPKQTGIQPVPEHLLWPVLLLLLLAILYALTMCPTIYPGDGAELTAAAWCLGVPHPTGYPLFMMLGFVAQRAVPWAEPALMMNILTMLCSLVAALGVYFLVSRLMGLVLDEERSRSRPVRGAACGVAFLVGAGATWWSASTSTEVYSLLMAFVVWIWVLGIALLTRPSRKKLFGLAVLTGFAFLHHQLVLVTAPMTLAAVWAWWQSAGQVEPAATSPARDTDRKGRVPTFLLAVVLGFLPLLAYAYLPLSAASRPPINIGNPSNFERFLDHVRGGQFRSLRVLSDLGGRKLPASAIPGHLLARMEGMLVWIGAQVVEPAPDDANEQSPQEQYDRTAREWTGKARMADHHSAAVLGLILVLLAGVGFYGLLRRKPLVGLGLLGGLVLNLAVVLIYTIADINVYQLPLWLLVVAFAAVGPIVGGEILAEMSQRNESERWLKRVVGIGVVFAFLGLLAVWNFRLGGNEVAKQDSLQAKAYADAMMNRLPENAVVFTSGDFDIYPLWYAQVCEGKRPDVAVVGANFIFQEYYRAMLQTTLPPGVRIYVREHALGGMDQWLEALIGGAIAPQLVEGRPVFITFSRESAELYALSNAGLTLEPVFRFDSHVPDDHPMFGTPVYLWQITADADSARSRYQAFLNSPRFPDAAQYMVESHR